MSDVTRMLDLIEAGDAQAGEQLLPLVYDELRKLAATRLAHEKPGQTLQATALVHEAYLRLVRAGSVSDGPGNSVADASGSEPTFANRAHFFAAAAEAMRRILINRARDKGRQKRGGERSRVDLAHIAVADDASESDLLAIDEALVALEKQNKPCAELVKLRFFAGLTMADAAQAAGISTRTAHRYWAFARAWLYDALSES